VKHKPSRCTFARNFPGIMYRSYVRTTRRTMLCGRDVTTMTGLGPRDLATAGGFPVEALMLPEDREKRRDKVANAIRKGRPFEFSYPVCRKPGGLGYFREYGVPIFGPDGQPSYISGVILDGTEQKQLEEDIQEAQSALRALYVRLTAAQETEQKRISHELHDGLGQLLTSLKRRLHDAVTLFRDGQTTAGVESLKPLLPILQTTISDVRRISAKLHPPVLDDLGIVATITWLCRDFSEVYRDMRIETDISIEERDVPGPLKTAIYRIAQEALNNIVRHAGASLVRLRFHKSGKVIEMIIEDNGSGFDTRKAQGKGQAREGLGLAFMEERVKMSSGTFTIASSKGIGTILRATWQQEKPFPSSMVGGNVDARKLEIHHL
jgi:signal transduction histidine kinase